MQNYFNTQTKPSTYAIDTYKVPDSLLLSCLELESSPIERTISQTKFSELLSEIEVINEDRERLKLENENLRKQLQSIPLKNVQIELLSKLATKNLERPCHCRKPQDYLCTPSKVIRQAIRIASPSDYNSSRAMMHQTNGFPKTSRHELNTSPSTQHRYSSSKVRVARNPSKFFK